MTYFEGRVKFFITFIILLILIILLVRAIRKPNLEKSFPVPESLNFPNVFKPAISPFTKVYNQNVPDSLKNSLSKFIPNAPLLTNNNSNNTTNTTTNTDTTDTSIKRRKKKTRSSKEDQCREIFERLFNTKFPTKRPNFLVNPATGKNLELDGYNELLQLAFEYDGEHHYNFPNTFHKTREDFDKQQERDKYKRLVCEKKDITVITIPYTVPPQNLEAYIIENLKKQGFEKTN